MQFVGAKLAIPGIHTHHHVDADHGRRRHGRRLCILKIDIIKQI